MTNETKVGAFTVCGLALLAAILVGLSGIRFFGGGSYKLYATFPQVVGLNPSAEVRFAGVPAGKVDAVEAEGMHVLVKMTVDGDIKVPRGSKITVDASGFLGEKYVNILPARDGGVYFNDGDRVAGTPEQDMNTVMAQMSTLVEKSHEMLDSINSVVNNPELKESLVATAVNMRGITANVREMTGAFARMSTQNEGEIANMVQGLSALSQSLSATAQEVEGMVHGFAGDGETAANLKATVANLQVTSARVAHMAESMEGIVTDPKTAEDLKATLANVRGVSEKANKMLGGLSEGGGVRPGLDLMYSGKESNWRANFDVDLNLAKDKFVRLGVNEIGEGNRFNLQGGKRMGAITARAGVIDSEVGIGLDADAGKSFRFSVDAYDLNDVRLRPRASFRIAKGTWLFGQMNDANRSDKRATYFGLRQEF